MRKERDDEIRAEEGARRKQEGKCGLGAPGEWVCGQWSHLQLDGVMTNFTKFESNV